jgi:hypothetical protein
VVITDSAEVATCKDNSLSMMQTTTKDDTYRGDLVTCEIPSSGAADCDVMARGIHHAKSECGVMTTAYYWDPVESAMIEIRAEDQLAEVNLTGDDSDRFVRYMPTQNDF